MVRISRRMIFVLSYRKEYVVCGCAVRRRTQTMAPDPDQESGPRLLQLARPPPTCAHTGYQVSANRSARPVFVGGGKSFLPAVKLKSTLAWLDFTLMCNETASKKILLVWPLFGFGFKIGLDLFWGNEKASFSIGPYNLLFRSLVRVLSHKCTSWLRLGEYDNCLGNNSFKYLSIVSIKNLLKKYCSYQIIKT